MPTPFFDLTATHNPHRWYLPLTESLCVGPAGRNFMFGGVGLYCDDLFFALLSGDALYFKVDASNRADYEARGARQFMPFPDRPAGDKPHSGMGYFELPADALEDADECVAWARRSVAVALAAARRPSAAARRRN